MAAVGRGRVRTGVPASKGKRPPDVTDISSLPAGVVTTADLYRKLGDISEVVIRMEERVKVLPDFEQRLRVVERFRYTLMGASLFAGTASGIVAALLTRGHP
jgi:hypothetical protein